ncbi:MAG: glycosyltransferase [Proteobacteria bacterium]|nr:glycosyltransferase [Pseudomonadota bacterium]
MTKLISIVTPMFNEEDNVTALCDRIATVMQGLPYDYEHICIDNCSRDRTAALLRERAARDPRLKVIINTRNFGHIRSPYHALLQAGGDAAVVLAGDLQDPPELIPELLRKWEEGFKAVMTVKPESTEASVMSFIRKLYYRTINRISDVPLVDNATGAGLYDRAILDVLRRINDPYPYARGLISEIGYPVATVPFVQPRRTGGVTSQNFYTLYDLAMLGITKHSKVPLRLMTMLGFALACISLLVASGYLVAKLLFWQSFVLGTAPVLIGMFFFGAVQLFFLGLLGEYIGTIQTQVRNLPLVVEAERINFDRPAPVEQVNECK